MCTLNEKERNKTIIILKKKKSPEIKQVLPRYINQTMINHLPRDGFFDDYFYCLTQITSNEGANSRVEITSKFGNESTNKINCTLEQMDYLFDHPIVLLNPVEVPRSLCITTFMPSLSKKIYCFIY